ncbi:Mu transposase C-terminal domain-containing protein [Gracilibacillus salinarum]|uniref:Mu transposase C-terminal domain-containing protein n=1 Tax=Gracilibacillus salinarum TaxID=2932255 RepID=A0ABY4GKF1_9BACI|nr:Mu transposase C-terminal domain-containing protein [Gracilibacillus salinarum]UOQ84651.1 Mu transposase C-terminal domain-containing protein [Gracilibacillus salinarum]
MELKENFLLQYHDGRTIRIVFCERLSSIIYAIDMNKVRWPFLIREDELISDYNNEEITILENDPYTRYVVEEELSNAEKERRNQACDIVNFVLQQVDREVLIFQSKYREKAIKLAVSEYKINYSTVKSYLVRYWKGGKIRNGLLPAFNLCGSKGKDRKEGDKKRGRPRKIGSRQGINIDDKVKRYFKTGLNRYYYNGRQNSLKVTYELILKDFFTETKVDINGNEVPVIKEPSSIPTYPQFFYWFKKLNNPKKELINRKGARNYFQNHRAIIGNSTQDAGLGPGTLWQIDSTQFDIYLVSSVDRNLIVGRPTLICVIDVFSRMIVGVNVTFESFNSYTGTMVALANSMLPKSDFCKQFGITLDKDEWDVACVPQRIFADRGELNGKQIEDAIGGLGISIQNTPPYRADYKGIIEQAFAQLNIKVKPFADGVVKNGKNTIERGDEDYRLKANLTIDEFTRIVIKCVLFHNNHHVLSEYVLDEMMISEEVEKIPVKIWDYGVNNMKGQLRVLPEQTVKMHLLPTDIGTITSRGVRFKKMLYASDYSLKNNWFQSARINGSKKIKIWYDPRDLSYVYTINEDGEFHKLHLLEHLTKYENKGIDEINQIIKHEQSIDNRSKEQELQEKMKLYDDIQTIVGQGKKKTAAQKDDSLSRAQRLRGIRENQREKRELKRELNIQKVEAGETLMESVEKQGHTEDELDLFRAIQELDWDDDIE